MTMNDRTQTANRISDDTRASMEFLIRLRRSYGGALATMLQLGSQTTYLNASLAPTSREGRSGPPVFGKARDPGRYLTMPLPRST